MRRKPKRLKWRAQALADLQQIEQWLGRTDGGDAVKTIGRIRTAAQGLLRLGNIGRPSIAPGVRELSVRTAPYVVVYRIEGDIAEIIAVYHTASDR